MPKKVCYNSAMVKQPQEVESKGSDNPSTESSAAAASLTKDSAKQANKNDTRQSKQSARSTHRTVNDVKKSTPKAKKKSTTIETSNIAEAEIVETSTNDDKTKESTITNGRHDSDRVKTLGEIAEERERRKKSKANQTIKHESIKDESAKSTNAAQETERESRGKRKKASFTKRSMPFFFRVIFSALLLAGLSILLTWYIIWRSQLNDIDKTWEFIDAKPLIFSYSCLIIFAVMAVIASITWRVFLAAGISFAAASILMYANAEKFAVRAVPVLPEDLQMADQVGAMTSFIDMNDVVRLACGIALLLLGVCLLEHYLRRWIGKDTKTLPWWEKVTIVPRIVMTLVSLTALMWIVSPIVKHPGTNSYSIEWLDAHFEAWHQILTYEDNGFIFAFIYNLGTTEVEQPADYNKEHIREILAKYDSIKTKDDGGRQNITDVVDNIIFVLSESFYDPNLLSEKYQYTGEDLIPNVHRAMASGLGGYMYSPEYGGGTANIEFEAYTGLTNYWSHAMPYVDYVSKIPNMPGLVRFAKQNGYETTAIHAYDGTMYKRNFAYPNMGFDRFIDVNQFKYTERETPMSYINDWSIYHEALDVLNSSTQPQMIGLVTMQGHTAFSCGTVDDRVIDIPNNPDLAADYTCLYKADRYLGEFIEELKKSDKRTVMLWFGDHAAGVLDDFVMSDDKIDNDLAHLTPYFIWANFKLDKPYSTKEVAKINSENGFDYAEILSTYWATTASRAKTAQAIANSISLPTVTPNCMVNTMFDALDVKKPALFYLVGEVCETTPILTSTYLGAEAPTDSVILQDYQLVNYDILNGERYWLK